MRIHPALTLPLALAAPLTAQSPLAGSSHVHRIPISELSMRAHAPLPGSPDWMAVGFGSLWVVNYKPYRVSRVDPATGAVAATVPLKGKACLGVGITSERLWVPTCGAVVINEIDGRTARLLHARPVAIHVGVEGSFAIAAGSFWLPVTGPDSSSQTVARVCPRTGAVQKIIPTASGSEAIVAGFGAVWVASSGTNTVLRIDPTTNEIVARIPVGPCPKFMTVGEGALWVQNRGDGSVSRIDPSSNREAARIAAHAPTAYGDIAVGDGAVWLAVDSTLVTRIDPHTNSVTYQITAPSGADAVRVGFGALWLADHLRGDVWGVDLETLRRIAASL